MATTRSSSKRSEPSKPPQDTSQQRATPLPSTSQPKASLTDTDVSTDSRDPPPDRPVPGRTASPVLDQTALEQETLEPIPIQHNASESSAFVDPGMISKQLAINLPILNPSTSDVASVDQSVSGTAPDGLISEALIRDPSSLQHLTIELVASEESAFEISTVKEPALEQTPIRALNSVLAADTQETPGVSKPPQRVLEPSPTQSASTSPGLFKMVMVEKPTETVNRAAPDHSIIDEQDGQEVGKQLHPSCEKPAVDTLLSSGSNNGIVTDQEERNSSGSTAFVDLSEVSADDATSDVPVFQHAPGQGSPGDSQGYPIILDDSVDDGNQRRQLRKRKTDDRGSGSNKQGRSRRGRQLPRDNGIYISLEDVVYKENALEHAGEVRHYIQAIGGVVQESGLRQNSMGKEIQAINEDLQSMLTTLNGMITRMEKVSQLATYVQRVEEEVKGIKKSNDNVTENLMALGAGL